MIISMIAAIAQDFAIGKDNDLVWSIKDDMRLFRQKTTGHAVLMGRKTFESFGRPLKNRTNLVVTRNTDWNAEGAHVFNEIQAAIDYARELGEGELFIIGGGTIYKALLPQADRLYISHINTRVPDAEAFFPEFHQENWQVIESEKFEQNERNEFAFEFKLYERK